MLHTLTPDARGWWALSEPAVAQRLETDPVLGLTEAEAARRWAAGGPNEIVERRPPSPWAVLGRQFTNSVVGVLLAAAVISAAIGDAKDTAVILAIVVLDAVIGFVQERKADRAVVALRRMASPYARVVRDGATRTIPARELVAGDLIELDAGDIVPADGRLVEAPNLLADEAALTGEAVPVGKQVGAIAEEDGAEIAGRRNMVFKGTAIPSGRGRAVVTDVGMGTALGQIAGLLESHQAPTTPLQQRLSVLGRQIALWIVAVCAVVFAFGIARGESVSRMLLASVSLAVAAIPEALPAVVTISLALGAQRMARHHAVIRKLPAVETLGSVTVIASDKTGTLTEGRMVIEHAWLADGTDVEIAGRGYEPAGDIRLVSAPGAASDVLLRHLARAAALCNDAALVPPATVGDPWDAVGDPTEGALLALAGKAGVTVDDLRHELPRVAEQAFDPHLKRMTTFHARAGGGVVVAAKGALEALAPDDAAAARHAQRYADEGHRVLAIAGGEYPDLASAQLAAGDGLTLYGLVAMEDPPRPAVAGAIAEARSAGIRTVMITGDDPRTARAVAARLGILGAGTVVTGAQLGGDPAALAERVNEISVFARTTPEQKLAIVEALKDTGHVVAMTGDGVNDAPALRRSDIGVAMGIAGTDVSKEAADMVLTDDNFATIVAATREGRRIYDNIRRFVRYGLTGGSAEIWVMLVAPLFGLSIPLLPVQILWLNLLTHGLPGLALGVERADPDSMRRPPRAPTESILGRGLWQHVLRFGALTALVALALAVWEHRHGGPWQTMLLTTLALLQLGNSLAARAETTSTFRLGFGTNRFLLATVAGTVAVQLAVIYWSPLQDALDTEALELSHLLVVLVASTITFWAIELDKLVRRRRAVRPSAGGRAARHQ